MAYKAVFINQSHIAHAGYKEDWQGKWHGSDGTYQVKPEWAKANSNFGRTDQYEYKYTNAQKDTAGGSGSSSNSNSNTNTPPPAPGFKNSDDYRYQNPKNMTDAQLKEARDRAILENAYNKNYPSRAEEFAKAANNTKQFINDGGTFVKKLMPDKIYIPLDLSNMSDEQLRAANNRAQLESQYNQYFNPPKQNKSKEWVDVAITGANLLLSASAIAAPIVWDIVKSKKQGG